jgi:hypothetical protein
MAPIVFPKWEDIPAVPGMPHGCLWGFFDKDGKRDEIGSKHRPPSSLLVLAAQTDCRCSRVCVCLSLCTALNLLTAENLKAAQSEVTTGERVQVGFGSMRTKPYNFGTNFKLTHSSSTGPLTMSSSLDSEGNSSSTRLSTLVSLDWRRAMTRLIEPFRYIVSYLCSSGI